MHTFISVQGHVAVSTAYASESAINPSIQRSITIIICVRSNKRVLNVLSLHSHGVVCLLPDRLLALPLVASECFSLPFFSTHFWLTPGLLTQGQPDDLVCAKKGKIGDG